MELPAKVSWFQCYHNITIFIDINECQSDVCEHNCHNSIGSYYCECNSGYRLDIQTNNTCLGEPDHS